MFFIVVLLQYTQDPGRIVYRTIMVSCTAKAHVRVADDHTLWCDMGVSENRGPEYSTQNSRILIRTPKLGTPIFAKP